MTTQLYDTNQAKARLSAGSAFKIGFFGALGVFVFYLVLSIVLGIIGLIVAATVGLGFFTQLFNR